MKAIYERTISDVAMEISIAREWRRKIFRLKENDVLEISFENPLHLPDCVREDMVVNKLTFYVKIVKDCPEEFDEGLIIFKFWAKEYPEICSYSGNNPDVL
ncbi:MAG: hypothetical protein IKK33_17305 [Lachnospiraceae bacterium]|nr:hypothetical protein [Lachnospiraceae bacterium]